MRLGSRIVCPTANSFPLTCRYKIFRLDRSLNTHPVDLSNTNKFRRNGGGSSKTAVAKLESLQKRAVKWILDEEFESYGTPEIYNLKCKQLDILPISARFDLHDLTFFHSVAYNQSCVELPSYLHLFSGSRLRSSHLDRLSYISDISPRLSLHRNTNFSRGPKMPFLTLSSTEHICSGIDYH